MNPGLMLAVLLQTFAGVAQAAPQPVIIVDDPKEIRGALDFKPDGTFTPSQDEAEAPRRAFAAYLDAQVRGEKNKYRKEQLGRIRGWLDRYVWYCGGYTRKGDRYLFCTFVLATHVKSSQGNRGFPVIMDGGASVCRCHFNLKTGKIVQLEWNGEA